jgi:hypothetical protein
VSGTSITRRNAVGEEDINVRVIPTGFVTSCRLLLIPRPQAPSGDPSMSWIWCKDRNEGLVRRRNDEEVWCPIAEVSICEMES